MKRLKRLQMKEWFLMQDIAANAQTPSMAMFEKLQADTWKKLNRVRKQISKVEKELRSTK